MENIMFIKIRQDESINSDYIIGLYIKDHLQRHALVARMIDGNFLVLQDFDTKLEADEAYKNFIRQANKKD